MTSAGRRGLLARPRLCVSEVSQTMAASRLLITLPAIMGGNQRPIIEPVAPVVVNDSSVLEESVLTVSRLIKLCA